VDLRIATWNVEYAAGVDRNERRRKLLLEAEADVLVLTETHDDLRLPGYTSFSTGQRPGRARPGSRWTTISSRLPVIRELKTDDRSRTCAVEVEGDIIVYGTVLPWHTDSGPSGTGQVNWSEFRRVVPVQGAEWLRLRKRYPSHDLVVAGDFNQSLASSHYYGSRELRRLLEQHCDDAGLQVLTGSAHEQAQLAYPAIDHVAVSPREGRSVSVVDIGGWEGAWEGPGRLSDHSGVVVSVSIT
jgi:endonuclease/exonuclease/phosphatase family metal-dependent hydrolase